MPVKILWLGHASVMITNGACTVYLDPWKVKRPLPEADIILVSHDHHDHYSEPDIRSLSKNTTRVLAPMQTPVVTDIVKPGGKTTVAGVGIEAVPAYNIDKGFHPKEQGWVGFILEIDGRRIYHTGDTDRIPQMDGLDVDLVLIPVGGTYTMDEEQAAQAFEAMNARRAIPIHFGDIVGSRENAERFARITKREVHILEPGESYDLA